MDIVIRSTVAFALIFVLLRVLGKRELAQLKPFEFVGLVVLGDLIQQGVTHTDTSLTGSGLAIITFLFWMYALSFVGWRFTSAAEVLEGKPVLIIHNGRIFKENLARDRMTVDEVIQDMRQQGILRIEDVALGVLESDGRISFIPVDQGGGDRPE